MLANVFLLPLVFKKPTFKCIFLAEKGAYPLNSRAMVQIPEAKTKPLFLMLQLLLIQKIQLIEFIYHSCPHHYHPHSQLAHRIFWMPGHTARTGT